MITGGQNQAPDGLPNVLHDQGLPNTLSGMGLPTTAARFPFRGVMWIAVLLVTLATLLVVLVERVT